MYNPNPNRYNEMPYNRCGKSGLKLSAISLGLWHNFGDKMNQQTCADILTAAFDRGVTHFDLANNYGPPPGSAEINFGKILKSHFAGYRDELIVSTKAGYYMWEGPYGEWGSKKNLVASLDQSLKRMQLEYVDIYYHHRPDPNTPIEETACALDLLVRQGKALYIGISNYNAQDTLAINAIFKELKTPFVIHQPCYNMINRWVEDELLTALDNIGVGCIPFSPLAQGILTNRYLEGIPTDSRANTSHFLPKELVNEHQDMVLKLKKVADERGQTIAQLAIAWLLNNPTVTSVLIGASRVSQLNENLDALKNIKLSEKELKTIDSIIR